MLSPIEATSRTSKPTCLPGTPVRQDLEARLAEVGESHGSVGVSVQHRHRGGGADGTPDGEELELAVFVGLLRVRRGGYVSFRAVGINKTTVEGFSVVAAAERETSRGLSLRVISYTSCTYCNDHYEKKMCVPF